MSTTTIRIEEDLKGRVAAAAERAGKTAHAFILEVLMQSVEQSELDDELHRMADERWARLLVTGKAVSWDEARVYVESRAGSANARRPVARKLAP